MATLLWDASAADLVPGPAVTEHTDRRLAVRSPTWRWDAARPPLDDRQAASTMSYDVLVVASEKEGCLVVVCLINSNDVRCDA